MASCCEGRQISILDNLPHTLTFEQFTAVQSSIGGSHMEPSSYATGKKGFVQSANHSEIERYGKYDQKVTHKILMDPDDEALLTIGDTILVTASDTDTFVGDRFEVRSHGEATAGMGYLSSVMVEKV